MKKFLCIFLSFTIVFSFSSATFASEVKSEAPHTSSSNLQIQRADLESIIGDKIPVMTQTESEEAIQLIDEKANMERLNNRVQVHTNDSDRLARTARITEIDSELEELGVIPLTIEDVYAIHGRTYRFGAPDEPNDTNYVNFYSLTTYIGDYEVYSIVAYSSGYSQSVLNVPFFREGDVTIYDKDAYVQSDFSKYIDLGTSIGSAVFEEAFDRVPILNYLGDVWNLATYFNPTAEQKVTFDYVCGQTYIYSYVAESSIGYFDFLLTAERKQGYVTMVFGQYLAGDYTVEETSAYEFDVRSNHWADYEYAVELYQNYSLHMGYSVGDIEFELNNQEVASFSMPYYGSLWSIPGI